MTASQIISEIAVLPPEEQAESQAPEAGPERAVSLRQRQKIQEMLRAQLISSAFNDR